MRDNYFPYTQTVEFAAEYLAKVFQETVKKVDSEFSPEVKHGEYIILETVMLNPGLIQSELANKISIQSSYVSKLLSGLEHAGYVRREQAIRGNRQIIYKIFITDKGKKVYKKMQKFIIDMKYKRMNFDDIQKHRETAITIMEIANKMKEYYGIKF